jgi:hypothetical protein
MKEYPIIAVLWEDHSSFSRRTLPKNNDLSEYIRPSLTVGLLYKKTRKYIVVVSHIDRYEDVDEADFNIIYRSAILGIQEYGTIKVDKLKGD